MVYTFAMGSQQLYDFIDNNPACTSYPNDYTNKFQVISENDRVVAINNVMDVDLYGQVSSESLGCKHISGTGGQFDFNYAAYHSKEGQSFICITSTKVDKEGQVKSRIQPFLQPGTIVTLPRTTVHQIVTEYGIADLKGKSTVERAIALINIAHPDFREGLIRQAEEMNILNPNSFWASKVKN